MSAWGRGACAALALFLPSAVPARAATPPVTLVVQITMDQLRGDLLERYRPVLTHGFRRIEDGGYWFHHATVDHGITVSFPGHTTLVTGMFPSHHGYTANEWWVDKGDGHWGEMEVDDDPHYALLGEPDRLGQSPRYLLATTLGEWTKAQDPRAKAIALGTGTHIPVAYAGAKGDAAYWFDARSGRFTSSTCYGPTILPWVDAFNRDDLAKYESKTWTLTLTPRQARYALAPAAFENHGRDYRFPHVYADEAQHVAKPPQAYADWFASTPMKDEALFALATRAVDAERLGRRGATDYLAIDVGATDDIGHAFGPRSLEQLDTLARLDRALGGFLDHLDRTVGRGRYVLVLSADHGAAEPPELTGHGGRVSAAQIDAVLDRVDALAEGFKGDDAALADAIAADLRRADFIADAYTPAMLSAPTDDPYLQLYQRTYRPGFTPNFPLWGDKPHLHHPARYGVIVRFKPDMLLDAATSVHGSPYPMDRWVPLIFYGGTVAHGGRAGGGRTVDAAPTLAAVAGIAAPKGLDGVVLPGVARRSQQP